MEEFLIVLTQGVADGCERKIKARLKELGEEDLFGLIENYARAVGIIESHKLKEELFKELEETVREELEKRKK